MNKDKKQENKHCSLHSGKIVLHIVHKVPTKVPIPKQRIHFKSRQVSHKSQATSKVAPVSPVYTSGPKLPHCILYASGPKFPTELKAGQHSNVSSSLN